MTHRATICYRPATADMHDDLVKIAKQSSYTNAFSNRVMFTSDEAYAKDWIWVAEADGIPVAVACVRHKKFNPCTMLYFVTVDKAWRRTGLTWPLLDAIMQAGPHQRMELKVMRDNEPAVAFYRKHGWTGLGEAYKNKGIHMTRTWE